MDDNWIKVEQYKTKYGNISNKYCIPINKSRGKYIILRKCIIEGGNWFNLKPTAKSLYITLLCNSEFDFYDSVEEEYDISYESRSWEFCYKNIYDMARMAGITTRSLHSALGSLYECLFIENENENENDSLKVFLEPPKIYTRESMNDKVKKSFGYLIKKRETKGLAKFHLRKQINPDLIQEKDFAF
jgi:hypothetical protein